MLLHPDKLVGVARAINQRPQRPQPSTEQAAIRSASQPRSLTPQSKPGEAGAMLEQLAYRLRDAHWADHMDRLARGPEAVAPARPAAKPANVSPAKPAQGHAPVLTLTIGAAPPKPNA